ncbi:MAG: hypothetical protein M3Y54_05445 [Bacteroidota bacterium]|nr:hypothetical protein [Bacteroidota bacterium]
MREIHLIDTSIFCRILRVPGLCSTEEHEQALAELSDLLAKSEVTLLLPVATIYETGNHIAQNGTGDVRRKAAQRFAEQVRQALEGTAPWRPTPLPALAQMTEWLGDFPTWATTGVGLGDLSIIAVFKDQQALNPYARIRIWSADSHLASYDYRPTGSLLP